MYFDVSFLKLGGYANWKMKRKNVGCIWEYQLKTKQENGFSLPEQRERLEMFCKFKDYEVIDYYEDAGISAKTGNHRPEFERLKDDIKAKKINTIVALKLDRITRSIYDWENLMTFLDENNAFPFKVEHVSGLANPNTTIKLARRSYETVYTTEYNVVDLKDYVTNQFPIKKTNEYVLSTNPGASTDYYLYFKEGLLSGTLSDKNMCISWNYGVIKRIT